MWKLPKGPQAGSRSRSFNSASLCPFVVLLCLITVAMALVALLIGVQGTFGDRQGVRVAIADAAPVYPPDFGDSQAGNAVPSYLFNHR